jgi:hypothetical protein
MKKNMSYIVLATPWLLDDSPTWVFHDHFGVWKMWYPVEYPIPSTGYHHNSKQPPRFAKWHAGQDPGGQQAAMVCCVTRATRREMLRFRVIKELGVEACWSSNNADSTNKVTRHEMLKLQKMENKSSNMLDVMVNFHSWLGKTCHETNSNLSHDTTTVWWLNKHQWEFQDPKMEVLNHIRPYFVGIFPYIGLKNRPYIW